ncbi:4Fe-4S dicluster domain-containing protein [Desulfococcaceae bacterium HSG9]|nr:4Fe-4S dicluster domain-containing protein [Desulfococcaceae bacterium HSG9]
MLGYIDKIREIAKGILEDKKIDMVIGFRQGSVPMMNEPCIIRHPDDVENLVWDSHCGINLANYLAGRTEKIGVIAKGCDSRNIVNHIIENKISREQLYIIGVPCKGMIDRHKLADMAAGEIVAVDESTDSVMIKGADFESTSPKDDVMQKNCLNCTHRNPVIYDILAADLVEEQTDTDRYVDVRQIEELSVEAKQRHFTDLFSACIRCYACRNACPLCYCPTCFVDESRPQWVGKGQDTIDIHTFHFLRAFHCAGRCTDCGACERACPVGINMRTLTKKLEKDCAELYNWEAGLTIDTRPPLDMFDVSDSNAFIK